MEAPSQAWDDSNNLAWNKRKRISLENLVRPIEITVPRLRVANRGVGLSLFFFFSFLLQSYPRLTHVRVEPLNKAYVIVNRKIIDTFVSNWYLEMKRNYLCMEHLLKNLLLTYSSLFRNIEISVFLTYFSYRSNFKRFRRNNAYFTLYIFILSGVF